MKHLRIINVLILCLAFIGCSKQIEYEMMITSAQSRGVTITYPDDYWGDIESLNITHNEKYGAEVVFHPKTIDVNGVKTKCIEFNVPHPNQNELEWSDDRLSAKGHSTLSFKSSSKNHTLRFDYSLRFSDKEGLYGGSSMHVSAVSFGENRIEREGIPHRDKFVIDITELIK